MLTFRSAPPEVVSIILSMALQNHNITMVANLLNKLLQSVIKIQQCSINCDDVVAVFFPILLNPNGFVHGQCFDCIL